MYFPDMTPYAYGGVTPKADRLNIGWLSRDHSFPQGHLDASLVNALKLLIASPVNLYRGSHFCEFCPEPAIVIRDGMKFIDEPTADITGNGEIRVTDANGITYVAPVLVLHYIVAHGYTPPASFIEAVLAAAQDGVPNQSPSRTSNRDMS